MGICYSRCREYGSNYGRRIIDCIVQSILECPKRFMKIAFVGVAKKQQKFFGSINKEAGIIVAFLNDYEKAKEWICR